MVLFLGVANGPLALTHAHADQAVADFEQAIVARATEAAHIASACLLEGTSGERLARIQQAMSSAAK